MTNAGRGDRSPRENAGRGDRSPHGNAGRGDRSPHENAGRGDRSPRENAGRGDRSPHRNAGRGDRSPHRNAGRGDRSPHRGLVLAVCAALVILVALAFQPALEAGFVDWDDDRNFVENLRWRGLERENLVWMATTFHTGHWIPLTWFTFGIDHELFGPEPRALHAVNLAWHAATAIAVFALARSLLDELAAKWDERRRIATAGLAAALFAVHPLRCESVCWITERRDLVSGAFFVLALLAWTRFARSGGRAAYVATLLLQTVSLTAKAWGIVLPALFLVLDLVFARRSRGASWQRLLLEKLPFAVMSLTVAIVTSRAHATATDARVPWSEHGLLTRTIQAGYGVCFYVWRSLVPLDLAPHYELPPAVELVAPRYVLSLALAVVLTVAAFRLQRRRPWAFHAWLAFLIVLAPVSGLAQAGPQLVADRYSYLACIPFAIVAAVGLAHPRIGRVGSIALSTLIVVVLVLAARSQSRVWHDSETLWRRALEHDPASAVANSHMASVLARKSDANRDALEKRRLLARAAEHYERAFRRSQNPAHIVNAGGILRLTAELEPDRRRELVARALDMVDAGIERGRAVRVDEPKWRRTRAALLLDLGRTEDARAELTIIAEQLEDDVVTHVLLARALEALERPRDALPHREIAARLRPGEPESWIALGETLARIGESANATAALEHGQRLARERSDTTLVERAATALAAIRR